MAALEVMVTMIAPVKVDEPRPARFLFRFV